jgi:hypothetical protein
MVQERVLEEGPGKTVTKWREQVADIGDLNGTQISYEEFCGCGIARPTGESETQASGKHSNQDLNQSKSDQKGGASTSKGKNVHDTDGGPLVDLH